MDAQNHSQPNEQGSVIIIIMVILAVLTIADNGEGIADADRPYVFNPFYSTREDPQYQGLGLSG